MGQHYVDGGEVGDWVCGDRICGWGDEFGGIEPVFVAEVREGPAAEFWLVGGSVDLVMRCQSLST